MFLLMEVDIYREWIAKEIERKLAKDAEIAKCRLVLRKEKVVYAAPRLTHEA